MQVPVTLRNSLKFDTVALEKYEDGACAIIVHRNFFSKHPSLIHHIMTKFYYLNVLSQKNLQKVALL
jgi:hypothetical protein